METRNLPGTDLQVSRVCLGSMTFGGQADEAEAERIVSRCLDAGIDFIDSANAYNAGQSEAILGRLLAGRRKDVVLATKVWHRMGEGADEAGLSRRAIFRAAEDSLRRLQTDHIDIYYLHQPDDDVPVEESLEAMASPQQRK